jgi:hypothetical protein
VIFAWIEERQNEWSVALLCRVLGVSRSGFYAWKKRVVSMAQKRREELTQELKAVDAEMKNRYGSPRMHQELVARGQECSVNFVAKLMREAGIAVEPTRKFVVTTDSNHSLPVAENVLDRNFQPEKPNAVYAEQTGEELDAVLVEVRRRLGSCTCDTSCQTCLRHYGNRISHERLDRHLALQLVDYIRSGTIPTTDNLDRQAMLLVLKQANPEAFFR